MEKLSELPTSDETKMTNHENEILNKYFDVPQSNSLNLKQLLKITAVASATFLLFANDFTQSMLSRLPYVGEEGIKSLMLKTLLFALVFILINKYYV